jgi:hypothetical protein
LLEKPFSGNELETVLLNRDLLDGRARAGLVVLRRNEVAHTAVHRARGH